MTSTHSFSPEAPVASERFVEIVRRHGFDFFTGVPCSFFGEVIQVIERQPALGYVSAVREDSAVGLAAGAYLGGRQPLVLMQNSGFASCINALASLHRIYALPLFVVVSWRGRDLTDAPEHLIVGRCMQALLDLLEIPFLVLAPSRMDAQVAALTTTMLRDCTPVALVVPEGAVR